MRLHQHIVISVSVGAFVGLVAACVGGPGQLPGEDGQQNLPSGSAIGSGSGSGSGGAASSSSSGSSTPGSPGRPPQVDPPVPFDAGVVVDSGSNRDSGAGLCTNTGQTSKIDPPACQTCLEQQCCAQLRNCFTLPGSATRLNCNQYNDCLNDCANAADPATCQTDCNSAAATGVTAAYNNIASCAQQKCLQQCQ